MSVLGEILAQLDCGCVRNECRDGGCSLSLSGIDLQKSILITMDDPSSPGSLTSTRCDYLYFGCETGTNRLCVSAVELTVGRMKRSTTIVAQLRAGANTADRLIPLCCDVRFVPVAAGPFGKQKRDEMRRRKNMISFRGHVHYPIAIECGSNLADALGYRTVS